MKDLPEKTRKTMESMAATMERKPVSDDDLDQMIAFQQFLLDALRELKLKRTFTR